MGSLTLPTEGWIYVDAQIVLYTVNRHPTYAPICLSIWKAVTAGTHIVVSSELILLESLVLPYQQNDTALAVEREQFWQKPNMLLLPITKGILREAARIRARNTAVRTPDAIHAATALIHGCSLFVTNDYGFRRVPGLPIVILDDVISSP